MRISVVRGMRVSSAVLADGARMSKFWFAPQLPAIAPDGANEGHAEHGGGSSFLAAKST